ncbi:DUF6686 family protein [Robertkochia solimangrovi]|uniref:DUF6686 family protein n=1 Tax=Robertkochia solimangrovi TaxID=2213046 RepID=UPI003BAEEBF7
MINEFLFQPRQADFIILLNREEILELQSLLNDSFQPYRMLSSDEIGGKLFMN